MNYRQIIKDADEILYSTEAPNISISWVQKARELAYVSLGVSPENYARISTKQLESGIWVAYDKATMSSCIATDEQYAIIEVSNMINQSLHHYMNCGNNSLSGFVFSTTSEYDPSFNTLSG